jgi:hypothetical protein
MNDLIKRYVAEVVRHLSEKDRKEIALELESNIMDMLGTDSSEEEVIEILNAMGDPTKLADTYRSRVRYLIGPDNFDLYLYVLKLVATVLASVTVVISLVTLFLTSEPTIVSITTSIFSNILNSLSGAFLWVTLTFALIDYFKVKTKEETWSVKDLPEKTMTESLEIKKSESIADIIASAVFIAILGGILYRDPDLFSIWISGQKAIPMFQSELIKPYILVMVALMALSLLRGIAKLQIGRWTARFLAASTALDFTVTAFLIYVLSRHDLANPAFIDLIPKAMGSWNHITTLASIVLVAITVLGAGTNIFKVIRKGKR